MFIVHIPNKISPNLAFLCRNLDYKPYSFNQTRSLDFLIIIGLSHSLEGMLAFICNPCSATRIYALLLQSLPHKYLWTPA